MSTLPPGPPDEWFHDDSRPDYEALELGKDQLQQEREDAARDERRNP